MALRLNARACLVVAAVMAAAWQAPATAQDTLQVTSDSVLACVPGEVLTYAVDSTVHHTRSSGIRALLTVADIGSLPSSATALPAHVVHRTRQLFASTDGSTVCMRVYYLHDLHVAYPESGGSPTFDKVEALPVVIGLYSGLGALVEVLEFEPPSGDASPYVPWSGRLCLCTHPLEFHAREWDGGRGGGVGALEAWGCI